MRFTAYEEQFDINSVDGPDLTPQISGIIGLCLASFLCVVASWRLLYHYSGWCDSKYEEEDVNHYRIDRMSTKRMLHGLLWSASVVEIVAYADMVATNSNCKLSYSLLDVVGRGILEFSTFIVGSRHWFHIISESRAVGEERLTFALFPIILAIITIAVIISSTIEVVDLWAGGYDTVEDFQRSSKMHQATLLVDAVAYLALALIVAKSAAMVHKRISSLPTMSQVRQHAKRNIINKMMIPMIFCALSYALRSAWMATDFTSRIISPDTNFESGVCWWVGNCWLPTIIPSIMLLYSIRKRDRVVESSSSSSDGRTKTLVKSSDAETHANPFQSFQQTFQDFEDEGASLPDRK